MATFPTTADELTAEFLSTVLSAHVASFDVQLVEAQGAMTTAARIELQYTGAAPANAPSAIFAKWASPIPAVQQMLMDRYGEDRIRHRDTFTSVATGLAIVAQYS